MSGVKNALNASCDGTFEQSRVDGVAPRWGWELRGAGLGPISLGLLGSFFRGEMYRFGGNLELSGRLDHLDKARRVAVK